MFPKHISAIGNYSLGALRLLECFITATVPETPGMPAELNSVSFADGRPISD